MTLLIIIIQPLELSVPIIIGGVLMSFEEDDTPEWGEDEEDPELGEDELEAD